MKTGNKKETAFDPRDQPAYTTAEAARYVKLPVATLRSWVVGRPYPRGDDIAHSKPLIRPAGVDPTMLSFWNLVEAHVLRALRTDHAISLQNLRKALDYGERELGIERLLLSEKLRTKAGSVFVGHYGKLIELSASGQLAMKRLLEEHLKRVEWERKIPVRLFPFLNGSIEGESRPVVIDPRVAFGRPFLASKGVSTRAIADRIDAGETIADLAADYGLEPREIEEAVLYERAA